MKLRYGHLKESAQNEFKNKLDLDNPKSDTVVGEVLSDLEYNVDDETRDLLRRRERELWSCYKKESLEIKNLRKGDNHYLYDVIIKTDEEKQIYDNCRCTKKALKAFAMVMD